MESEVRRNAIVWHDSFGPGKVIEVADKKGEPLGSRWRVSFLFDKSEPSRVIEKSSLLMMDISPVLQTRIMVRFMEDLVR